MASDIYGEVPSFALDGMCEPEKSIVAPSVVQCDVYVQIKEVIYFSISRHELELYKLSCIHIIECDQKGYITAVLMAP